MPRPIENARVARAKRAFTTRNVPQDVLRKLSTDARRPRSGDLVLARIASVGNHQRIELTTGRKSQLYRGDEIIVAFGDRYAPDQYEAEMPTDLGPCHLVASGGVASLVRSKSDKVRDATAIEPIGLFVDDNDEPINVRSYSLAAPTDRIVSRPMAITVVGGSMNAGKTETAVSLIRGYRAAGLAVGAAKLTGTGSGNDLWRLRDAGACAAYDFTDAGLVSTYKADVIELERVARTLAQALINEGAEVMVFEIADGLYQTETQWLMRSRVMEDLTDGYIYAAESAASAIVGAQWVSQHARLLAVSGCLTMSPLATREAQQVCGTPCLGRKELQDVDTLMAWRHELTAVAGAQNVVAA